MFIFTTDWHLSNLQPINRKGDILEDAFLKIEQLFEYAQKHNLPIVHGGDLFDQHGVTYSVLNRLIDTIKKYNVVMHVVVGNHDLVGSNINAEGTALHTLIKSGVVFRLDALTINNRTIKGIHYFSQLNPADDAEIIVAHLPLISAPAPFDHILLKDVVTKAKLVLCGHIHNGFIETIGETTFANPGCFVRRKINEADIAITAFHVKEDLTFKAIKIKHSKTAFTKKDKDAVVDGIIMHEILKVEEVDLRTLIITSKWDQKLKNEILTRLDAKL